MERLIRRVVSGNKTLLACLLAGLGAALSYTHWRPQPPKKQRRWVRQRSDYPAEWLGI